MSDDYIIRIYESLVDDEVSKALINLINEKPLNSDEDFENLLEVCLDLLETVD